MLRTCRKVLEPGDIFHSTLSPLLSYMAKNICLTGISTIKIKRIVYTIYIHTVHFYWGIFGKKVKVDVYVHLSPIAI